MTFEQHPLSAAFPAMSALDSSPRPMIGGFDDGICAMDSIALRRIKEKEFNSSLTASELREIFSLDPERGILIRKSGRFRGAETRATDDGKYVRIRVGKSIFAVHRLIWLHVNGHWPTGFIDHINGDPSDNRLVNLRDVTHAMNIQNIQRADTRSKTGLRGVYPYFEKFVAQIAVKGKLVHLGIFNTKGEAHAAYLKAKAVVHPGYLQEK